MTAPAGSIRRVARVSPAESRAELDQAYDLFARGFPPSYFEAQAYFDFLRGHEPPVALDNHLLAWSAEGALAGAIRIVDRTMTIDGVPMTTAGMSYYAIAPPFQSGDCGRRLIDALFTLVSARGYDLSVGIARRVMDGYWSRFGFIGFGGFHTLTTSAKVLRSLGAATKIDLRVVLPAESIDLAEFHAKGYESVSGALLRDARYWQWWFSRLRRRRDLTLSVFRDSGDAVGYVVQKGSAVIEIGARSGALTDCLVALGGETTGDVVFNLAPNHPVATILNRTNYTASSRRAWTGGYIMKVNDRHRFLAKLHARLEHRLRVRSTAPFAIECNEVAFSWDGNAVALGAASGASGVTRIGFDTNEWPKLLLGLAEPPQLKGFSCSGHSELLSLLFPVLTPQMPELDEF